MADRDKFLQIRISDAEKIRFKNAADRAGLSVTAWIRLVLFAATTYWPKNLSPVHMALRRGADKLAVGRKKKKR
jgi:hypothetical protein